MIKRFNPPGVAAPMSPYSHGVSVPAGMRTVHVAGQVGITVDGVTPPSVEEQIEIVWDNIEKVLTDGGLKLTDIVSIRGYLLSRDAVPAYRAGYRTRLGDTRPASTLVVVSSLVAPQFLVEIEAMAARP